MEPVKLYERVESLYQWAWRFQLQHGAQLLPWERSWLAQILHEFTDDLTKLAAMLDIESPWAQPSCLPDSAEALSDLAEHTLGLAEQATKLAQHTLHRAELALRLARCALQAADEARRLPPTDQAHRRHGVYTTVIKDRQH